MVCDPNDNNLNPPVLGPPPAIPGFGIPIAPPSIDFPDLSLPDGIPEDLLALLDILQAKIPGATLFGNVDNFSKEVLDVIASLLNQLGPYLALYNFFQALLNMIGCIMDILCCLNNPFCLVRAIRKLFKRCLPDFLNLFPWLALLAMIIALILLLLAIIDYIIDRLAALIQDIIDNINDLASAVQINATEDDLEVAARKIAQVLCLIEQLFAILIGLQAIFAVIQTLADIAGRSFCGSSRSGDDTPCCGDEFCPPFIKQNPDGLVGSTGRLIYHTTRVNAPLGGAFANVVLPSIRTERWQFVDDGTPEYPFKDIITPINDFTFWPDGKAYDGTATPKKVPYLLDMTLSVDPQNFGHDNDTDGPRNFFIQDVVVTLRPYIGVRIYNDSLDASDNNNGTLRLSGGKVYEEDGVTPFLLSSGLQADLDSFISLDPGFGAADFEDGYDILNVDYNLRYNHEVLVQEAILTIGCIPEVEVEREIANVVVPNTDSIVNLLNLPSVVPDISGALACLNASLTKFRADASIENAAIMQAEMEACLNNLRGEALGIYDAAVENGTNVFKSTVTVNPDTQFIDLPIKAIVTLRDSSGTVISFNVPEDSQDTIAGLISGQVTFGKIGKFSFDSELNAFVADITSDKPGTGELIITFNDNVLSTVLNQDDDDEITTIVDTVVTYEFVGSAARAGVEGTPDPLPRRDEGDVAQGE